MKKIKFELTGIAPLIMHSDQGVDPTHPLTKQSKKLTSKRNKTEEDQINIMYLDWELALYYDEKDGPIIPSANIDRALIDSAKMKKLGTHFKRGVRIPTLYSKLQYKGPRKQEDLKNDKNWDNFKITKTMKVGMAKVMRCRPIFQEWSLKTEVHFDDEILDKEQIVDIFENCGKYIGLCDSRPKYGTFKVKVV